VVSGALLFQRRQFVSHTKKAKQENDERLGLPEAIRMVKAFSHNPKEKIKITALLHTDFGKQTLRGIYTPVHSSGDRKRVAVFARGEKAEEARRAGADIVGEQDLVDQILAGNINFSRVVATPDMMPVVAKVARILGPRGMMPNPKMGTVTMDITEAVKGAQGGTVPFRSDKEGRIRTTAGKSNFTDEQLTQNIMSFWEALGRFRPKGAKTRQKLLNGGYLTATWSPSVQVNTDIAPFTKRRAQPAAVK